MKVIFSRKGFDSSFGGYPSPIMPDGRLLSLPIPVTQRQEEGIPYYNLSFGGQPISEIIDQLSNGQFRSKQAHLDPDLDETRFPPRPRGWIPIFGQTGGPQFHLQNQGVDTGDLFLFYGWFRRTRYDGDRLCYVRPKDGGEDLHIIFGWLQIGCSYNVNEQFEDLPPWVDYHPHVINRELYHRLYHNNKIYIASGNKDIPGAGIFKLNGKPLDEYGLVLTKENCSRSKWCFPPFFKNVHISCHGRYSWKDTEGYFQSARGQEFVVADDPCVEKWAKKLIEKNRT